MYYLLLGDDRLLDFSKSFWYLIMKPSFPFETFLDIVLFCSAQKFHWFVFFRKINTLLLLPILKNKKVILYWEMFSSFKMTCSYSLKGKGKK